MKITKSQLKWIIKEELSKTLKEDKGHTQAKVGDYLLVKTGDYPDDDAVTIIDKQEGMPDVGYADTYRTTIVAQIIKIATERNPDDDLEWDQALYDDEEEEAAYRIAAERVQ